MNPWQQSDQPGLDELAADPAKAQALPSETRSRLILRCAALLAVLSVDSVTSSNHGDARNVPEDRLLTVPEAAKQMGFAPSYVYELVRRRRIRAVRHGKYVRISQSAIDVWRNENEQAADAFDPRCGPVRRGSHGG